jgi:hypothetical protein
MSDSDQEKDINPTVTNSRPAIRNARQREQDEAETLARVLTANDEKGRQWSAQWGYKGMRYSVTRNPTRKR